MLVWGKVCLFAQSSSVQGQLQSLRQPPAGAVYAPLGCMTRSVRTPEKAPIACGLHVSIIKACSAVLSGHAGFHALQAGTQKSEAEALGEARHRRSPEP